MAKLFMGCDHIRFTYDNISYKGILSKLILEKKTVYRVDYTCRKNDFAGRFEVTCAIDPQSGQITWQPHLNTCAGMTLALGAEIEKKKEILRLEN